MTFRSSIKAITFVAGLLIASLSFAQTGGPAIDQFQIGYISGAGNYATAGVALSSSGQTVNTGIKNLVLVLFGQSNCADVIPSAYSPSNPTKIDQLNIYDGAIRVAGDPLIGTSYPQTAGVAIYGPGNMYLRVADTLITNGKFARVIIVPACVGATKVADWAPGSYLQDIVPVTFRRIAANGIAAGTNVTIAVIWAQGESDTDAGTGQSAYTTSLNAVIAASRTAGFTGLWFVNSQSRSVGAVSAAVIAAQAAVVNHGSNVWAGLDMDALAGNVCNGTSACRQADDTHLSVAGAITGSANMVTRLGLSGAPF